MKIRVHLFTILTLITGATYRSEAVSSTTIEFSGVTTSFSITETTRGVPDVVVFAGLNIPVGTAFTGFVSFPDVPAGGATAEVAIGPLKFLTSSAPYVFNTLPLDRNPGPFDPVFFFSGYAPDNFFIQRNISSSGLLDLELVVGGTAEGASAGNTLGGSGPIAPDHWWEVNWKGTITNFRAVPEHVPTVLLLLVAIIPILTLHALRNGGVKV